MSSTTLEKNANFQSIIKFKRILMTGVNKLKTILKSVTGHRKKHSKQRTIEDSINCQE